MQSDYHKGVLVEEVVDLLQVREGKKYIDATLGGGGHTREILRRGGKVLGIDVDAEAIEYVRKNIQSQDLKVAQGNFSEIDRIAHLQGFEKVSGIVFDLGVSSHQIEDEARGFSFQKEGPLDMRMDQVGQKLKAADILNLADKDELIKIFTEFGEEPRARALASAIVRTRQVSAFRTNSDLLKVIKEAFGIQGKLSDKTKASIAKRVFQALRIAVNAELENIKKSLPKALSLLGKNGRLAVISFHSLEDRIIKREFLSFEEQGFGKVITEKPIYPSLNEQKINRRSRSAKLRVFESKS